jgi:hypothetical protein
MKPSFRLSFSQEEALLLLLAVESFLPEAQPEEEALLEKLLEKLSSLPLASPFSSASQARSYKLGL